MYACSASMVVYRNPPEMVRNAAASFLRAACPVHLTVVDNSPTPELHGAFEGLSASYHFHGANVGYGRGHNWAVFNTSRGRYHLILNPDIVIPEGTLEALVSFMDENPKVGMVAPNVLNPDGTCQYLKKRHPSLLVLFARRFLPPFLRPLVQRKVDEYETRDQGYSTVQDVEFVSGCFMLCRSHVLKEIGGFDPRYFMYFEDCDLSRTFQERGYRTVFYPDRSVVHLWERGAHKSLKGTWVFMVNMARYFNKWGWKLW